MITFWLLWPMSLWFIPLCIIEISIEWCIVLFLGFCAIIWLNRRGLAISDLYRQRYEEKYGVTRVQAVIDLISQRRMASIDSPVIVVVV